MLTFQMRMTICFNAVIKPLKQYFANGKFNNLKTTLDTLLCYSHMFIVYYSLLYYIIFYIIIQECLPFNF